MSKCERPPRGWRCTREAGHTGPCAAYPEGLSIEVEAGDDPALVIRMPLPVEMTLSDAKAVATVLATDWELYGEIHVTRRPGRVFVVSPNKVRYEQ